MRAVSIEVLPEGYLHTRHNWEGFVHDSLLDPPCRLWLAVSHIPLDRARSTRWYPWLALHCAKYSSVLEIRLNPPESVPTNVPVTAPSRQRPEPFFNDTLGTPYATLHTAALRT